MSKSTRRYSNKFELYNFNMDNYEHSFLEEYEDSNWQIPKQVAQKTKSKIDKSQLIKLKNYRK